MHRWIRAGARAVARSLPRLAYPVIRGPLRGARFILGAPAGPGRGASVYVGLVEPEQTQAFVRAVKRGDTVFDIGANVGYFTILASRLVGPGGRVVAFEPAIRNVAYLYRHVILNRAENVTIVAAACAETSSLRSLARGDNAATGHIVPGDREVPGAVPVPCTSIDEFVRLGGAPPQVMKIDVEGAEGSVLRGAQRTLAGARPTIFLSTHGAGPTSDCLAFLNGLGYSVEPLIRGAGDPAEFRASFTQGA